MSLSCVFRRRLRVFTARRLFSRTNSMRSVRLACSMRRRSKSSAAFRACTIALPRIDSSSFVCWASFSAWDLIRKRCTHVGPKQKQCCEFVISKALRIEEELKTRAITAQATCVPIMQKRLRPFLFALLAGWTEKMKLYILKKNFQATPNYSTSKRISKSR